MQARLICLGRVGIAALGCFLYSHAALAQSVPGSADAGRYEGYINQELKPDLSIKPPATSLDKITPDIPYADDGFLLNSIQLRGATQFTSEDFKDLFAGYIDHTVDAQTLSHLAQNITQHYRDRGYFLSKAIVPQQAVHDGDVIIDVLEGRVGRVLISDPEGLLEDDALTILEEQIALIEALDPLHGPSLERALLILNDLGGLSITSILNTAHSTARAGAVDVTLNIAQKDNEGGLSYNNYGSRFIGPHNFIANGTINNVLTAFDQLSLQATTVTPASEVKLGSLAYDMLLTPKGLNVGFSFSHSHTHPGASLKSLDVEGRSSSFSVHAKYPVIRSRRESLYISAALRAQNSSTEFLDQELIDDKLRIASIAASYSGIDPWDASISADVSFNKGINTLGATSPGSPNLSRAQGTSDFFSFKIDAQRLQSLNDHFQMLSTLSAQYTPHTLLSSQEFGYGGTDFGRAYDRSEISGDRGAAFSAELRYTNDRLINHEDINLVPFAFFDIGKVWNNDHDERPMSAASAGFGVHYTLANSVDGTLQVAYPLTKSVLNPIHGGEDGPRILVSASRPFALKRYK